MKYAISNIRVSLDTEAEELKRIAARKLGTGIKDITSLRITKESVDARRKPNISLVYSILVETSALIKSITDRDVRPVEEAPYEPIVPGNMRLKNRPVVVGSGPAGLFAALVLAQQGYKPLLVERGESVEKRTEAVHKYWKTGELNPNSNVQFGEGGAGTFSDGKLTTRINDRRCEIVLGELHKSGAQEEILYKARPHIGTDVLKSVVVNIRNRIVQYGGEVRFEAKLTSVRARNGRVEGIVINGSELIDTEVVVLAIGHSARDTFQVLLEQGVSFIPKPFSIGVRIEHPQEIINKAQYGTASVHHRLGAADYQLFYKTAGRTVYSFCMCPGGIVVASASEQNTIVTNGMSEFARDRENANSAVVVSVEPKDFGGNHPLSGVEFQRRWERLAFEAGGRDNSAPVQRLEDFLLGRASIGMGAVKPSYTGSTKPSDMSACLPAFVVEPMREAIGYFDGKLKGFGMKDAVLTGVETRTSSPVRMTRGDSLEAEGMKGLYPCGEGAGYAGGIMSAAVDGIRVAEQIVRTYAPFA
ncbi:MAG: FAD-binding protein [Clostridia bacterium]|nr:FAD-binding protein [Clostridia bacterium]